MRTVFMLGSGRSGTRFLCHLFRHNARDCKAVHEPYVRRSRPAMFGRPIYDYTHGDYAAVRQAFERKRLGILGYDAPWYVETNHAFLKSFADVAMEAFPDMKLVHLVRDPLKTALSETIRESLIHRVHFPARWYRGANGRHYFRWSLTHDEPIYRTFDVGRLSLFQKYLIQWIEIENRACRFLAKYDKGRDCFHLHAPMDLNDPRRLAEMFRAFGMETKHPQVVVRGNKNRNPRHKTVVTDAERRQAAAVIDALPDEDLEIFGREPYVGYPWSSLLAGKAAYK